MPLDFSQPELVKWQVQNYGLPASQYGYDAVAADNVNELPSLNRADIQWALSSYLLANEQSTFLSISGVQDYGRDLRYPEYSEQIGGPQGEMYQDQKMYWRNYTRALVVVNPSSTQTFTAQLSRQYVDLYGNPLGKTITLSPHAGMVLLKMK